MHCILFIAFVGLTFEVVSTNQNNLIAVIQVFRHGHRTPRIFYKTDPYGTKESWEGFDLEDLTNKGKRQTFALGKLTHQRYINFLPKHYDNENFIASCTDMDRTLMSGQCFLYGLYPATTPTERWRANVDWQPIPLHPANTRIFSSFPYSCPAYNQYYANVYQSKEYQRLDVENSDLLGYLARHSGENITTILDTWLLVDCLYTEIEAGFDMPEWVAPVFEKARNLTAQLYKSMTGTTQAKRFYTGTFLNFVVEHFEKMSNNSTAGYKFQVFSGHDSNIAAILNSFEAFDPPFNPDYASSIWIELKRNKGSFYVNVWNKDGHNTKKISVNGCALDCPLLEFRKRLSHLLLDSATMDEECKVIK